MNTLNVLVTGSSGFLGTHVLTELAKFNYDITPFDITLNPQYDITNPDIDSLNLWDEADYCIHLAAMADITTTETNRHRTFNVNVAGTFNVVESCRKHGIPIIYASTCCLYGGNPNLPWTEETTPKPTDLYSETKLLGEHIVKTLPEWNILRLGTLVGPGQRATLATDVFLRQAEAGEPYTINGSGSQRRNWVDVRNAASAFGFVIKYEINNEVYNVAGDKAYTIKEMAEICHEVAGKRNIQFTYDPPRPGDFDEEVSSAKIERALGWTPRTSLRQSLEDAYRRKNE